MNRGEGGQPGLSCFPGLAYRIDGIEKRLSELENREDFPGDEPAISTRVEFIPPGGTGIIYDGLSSVPSQINDSLESIEQDIKSLEEFAEQLSSEDTTKINMILIRLAKLSDLGINIRVVNCHSH